MFFNCFADQERPVVKPTGDPSAPLRLIHQIRFGILSPTETVSGIILPTNNTNVLYYYQ
jgi:hypothetical protein